MTIQGFCKKDAKGNARLVFNSGDPFIARQAPIIQDLTDCPLFTLVEGTPSVGFTVVEVGNNHGLLHYDEQKAHEQAEEFSLRFGKRYVCIPLTVGEEIK